MSTNIEGSQVLAVLLIEGVVVKFSKLLWMLLSSSRPAQYRVREAGLCSGVFYIRAIALKSKRNG